MRTIGFLGGGNMAGAIIGGLLRLDDAPVIHVVDHNPAKLERLAALGAKTHEAPGDWITACDLFVLAVKPQGMKDVLGPVKAFLNPKGAALTIAAGIESAAYAEWLSGYPLIRSMPNTPAMVGEGVTGLWVPEGIAPEHAEAAEFVLSAVGRVVRVAKEEDIDLVGAIPGSGPAYVFRFMEALQAAAVRRGMPEADAKALALGTVKGAALLAEASGKPFSELREQVTSKGGTTARALAVMNARDIDAMMDEAVGAAIARTLEMKAMFR